ncbi:MAG: pilus assembly protein, partial [Dehalococcoidales bacterium]|nr:pilus assembly protein [Dehalococcoidales bacterium]
HGPGGQALVEFALILPLIVLLTAGLIDGARAILLYNTVSNAAREGARFGIVLSDPTWGDPTLSKNGNQAKEYTPANVATVLADGEDRTIVDRVMRCSLALDPAATTIDVDHGELRSSWPAVVSVKVTYRFTPIVLWALGQDGFDLEGASEMIIEAAG